MQKKVQQPLLAVLLFLFLTLAMPATAIMPLSEPPIPEMTPEDRRNMNTPEQRDRLATIQLARHAYLLIRETEARVFCGVDTARGFLAYDETEQILYMAYLASNGEVALQQEPLRDPEMNCLDAHAKLASFAAEVERDLMGAPEDGPLHCPVPDQSDSVLLLF